MGGDTGRSEEQAEAIVDRALRFAAREGLAEPYVEDYDDDETASGYAP